VFGRLLRADEAAKRFGLDTADVLAMVRAGRLAGVQVDGVVYVQAADVEVLCGAASAPPDAHERLPVSGDESAALFSAQYRVPVVTVDNYEPDAEVLGLLTKELCVKHKILPLARSGAALIVAMADPTDAGAMAAIRRVTGLNAEPVSASEAAITSAVMRLYRGDRRR
jgi:hypothetical protein